MPISGLLVTLSDSPTLAREAVGALRDHPAITVGPPNGRRLPIAATTPDAEGDRDLWHWLHEVAGVCHVDLVFASYERLGDAHETSAEAHPAAITSPRPQTPHPIETDHDPA